MGKGKNSQHQVKSRSQRKDELERKRDERARRGALKKEREAKHYYPAEDDENYSSFCNQLLVQGLKIRDIPGDGNCLFRALADQLEGNHELHEKYRSETVSYMEKHSDDFAPFIDVDTHHSFKKYLETLEKTGTFAGNDAIVAFARHHNLDVIIHQFNNPRFVVHGDQVPRTGMNIELHLAYHNGEHYSSLRRLFDPGSGPGYPYHTTKREPGTDSTDSRDKKLPENTNKRTVEGKNTRKSQKLLKIAENETPEQGYSEEQKIVITQTNCKDIELVQKAVVDYEGDIDGAISYVLQMMCLRDEENNWDEESYDSSNAITNVPKTSSESSCHECNGSPPQSNCNCHRGAEKKLQKQNFRPGSKTNKTNAKSTGRPIQLSNRQRKELAKQVKKKRREETKREQKKEELDTPETERNNTNSAPDLGSVNI